MMLKNTRQRLVDLAVGMIGWTQIVRWLEIEPAELDGWLRGDAQMPDDKLLALLELVDRVQRH